MSFKRLAATGFTAAAILSGGAMLSAGAASADTDPGPETTGQTGPATAGTTSKDGLTPPTTTHKAAPKWPTLKKGTKDPVRVKTLQWLLKCKQPKVKLSVTSQFDSQTEQAVKTYQRALRMTPDGKVGPGTWKQITERSQVSLGNRNDCVKALQVSLNSYGFNLPVNGNFGDRTQSALHQFQYEYGGTRVGVTDTVTPQTWYLLIAGTPHH
ncbi:peptidoglycan-binding domain-containing protein [Spirillospora sp. CA-255316]